MGIFNEHSGKATSLGEFSKKDLSAMPGAVQDTFGYALHLAQVGQMHPQVKVLRGFIGAGVLEVVDDYLGDTTEQFIRCAFKGPCMCCIVFRKNPSVAFEHHAKTLSWSARG